METYSDKTEKNWDTARSPHLQADWKRDTPIHSDSTNVFKNIIYLFISYTLVFFLHVCLCKDVSTPGTGVADSRGLPRGCQGLNPGPLEEQPVLLMAKSSLLSCISFKEEKPPM